MDTHGCGSPAHLGHPFTQVLAIASNTHLLTLEPAQFLCSSFDNSCTGFDILLGMLTFSFFAMDLAMSFYCQGTFCHIFIMIWIIIFRESITLQFTEIFLNVCHKESCKFLHLKDARNLTNFWNNLLDLCHLVLLNQSADDRCIPLPNADWAHDTEVFHLRLPTSQHLQK